MHFDMRKLRFFVAIALVVSLFSSCAKEFNAVYKSTDYDYKYEYAKECFANGKYMRAITLLEELVTHSERNRQRSRMSLHAWQMVNCNREL